MRRVGLERFVYHVVPDKDGGWELRNAPVGDVVGRWALKSDAIAHGQKRARSHTFAHLIVHKLDYTIEREWTHLVEEKEDAHPLEVSTSMSDSDDEAEAEAER